MTKEQAPARLEALGDIVIVDPLDPPKVTKGGIHLPETTGKQRTTHGIVVAVGPGKTMADGTVVAPNVNVGDPVLYPEYGGSEIMFDGKEYRAFHVSELLARIVQ